MIPEKKKREVIEQLLLQNYNKYYRLACSYVHNDSDAGDIVQNGAYKAILYSNKLKNIKYAETWLYRIMLNEIFANYRDRESVSQSQLFLMMASTRRAIRRPIPTSKRNDHPYASRKDRITSQTPIFSISVLLILQAYL